MARTGNNSRVSILGQYGGAPTFAADLSGISLDVESLIDPFVPTVADLPASGNWPFRTMWVDADSALYTWLGSTAGWTRQWSAGAAPFAMAAGVADVSQAGTVITFPTGRFTQPPIVVPGGGWVSASGAVGNPVIVKYSSLSATSVTLLSTTSQTVRGFWTATQMTPTSAEG